MAWRLDAMPIVTPEQKLESGVMYIKALPVRLGLPTRCNFLSDQSSDLAALGICQLHANVVAAIVDYMRCSTIRNAVPDLMTGFPQQSLSVGILTGSQVSGRLVAMRAGRTCKPHPKRTLNLR